MQKKDRRDRQDDGTVAGGDRQQHQDSDAGPGHTEERAPPDPQQPAVVHEDHQEGERRHEPGRGENTHPAEGPGEHRPRTQRGSGRDI